jgi:hypothetical protein
MRSIAGRRSRNTVTRHSFTGALFGPHQSREGITMRIAITLCALAAPALSAAQSTQAAPDRAGIGSCELSSRGGACVSVEASPGGIRASYQNETQARNACVAAHGTFTSTAGRMRCNNPTTPLAGATVTSSQSNVKDPPNLACSNRSAPGQAVRTTGTVRAEDCRVAAPSPTRPPPR